MPARDPLTGLSARTFALFFSFAMASGPFPIRNNAKSAIYRAALTILARPAQKVNQLPNKSGSKL